METGYLVGVDFNHCSTTHSKNEVKGTNCTIYRAMVKDVEANGNLRDSPHFETAFAKLNTKDKNFKKSIGRYVALNRALDQTNIPEYDKRQIRKAVGNKCKLQDPMQV